MKRVLQFTAAAFLLCCVVMAQSVPLPGGSSSSPTTASAGTFSGAVTAASVSTTGNITAGSASASNKLCLGSPCTTYLTTPGGTTGLDLFLNGWAFTVNGASQATNGFNAVTANPSVTNSSGAPLRVTTSNALLLLSTAGTTKVGNGTGDEGDGALAVGSLAIGVTGTTIDDSYAGSASIDFGSTTTTTADSSGITVTGAAVGDGCIVGVPVAAQVTGASFTCFVTATSTVVVRLTATGAAVDPGNGTFTVRTFDP